MGRSGEFCIAVGSVTMTAGILKWLVEDAGCSVEPAIQLIRSHATLIGFNPHWLKVWKCHQLRMQKGDSLCTVDFAVYAKSSSAVP